MLAESDLALLLQFLRGAETAVGFAFRQQLIGVLLIDLHALALPVGRVGAADLRPFGPVQAQPAQIFDQLGFVARLTSLHIGVLDAQQEVSSGVAGKEPVVERGAGIAHVQHSGGGGRKAHPCGWVLHRSALMLSSSDEVLPAASRERRTLAAAVTNLDQRPPSALLHPANGMHQHSSQWAGHHCLGGGREQQLVVFSAVQCLLQGGTGVDGQGFGVDFRRQPAFFAQVRQIGREPVAQVDGGGCQPAPHKLATGSQPGLRI